MSTKSGEARIVAPPDVLLAMLKPGEPDARVFDATNLRKAWIAATERAGLAGLLIHDLRRSAVRNLIAAGVPEKVCMTISGHNTRTVFDRYHIVDSSDVLAAMRKVEALNGSGSEKLVRTGERLVKSMPKPRGRKQLS